MIEIRHILCPMDFSDYSRRAFACAVTLAKWYDADVTLLHVCATTPAAVYAPASPPLPSKVITQEDRAQLLAAMEQFAATAAGAGVPMHFNVAEGHAAAEILTKAKGMPSDLIVMGTHGRSGFDRLMLGSATEKVLRKAACPVLTIPPTPPGTELLAAAHFRRLLCAVDFSDCSLRALSYALSLAQEAHARLTVVHVVELFPELPAGLHETVRGGPRNVQEYIAEAEQNAGERLNDAVPGDALAHGDVVTVVARGKAYREVLRIAAEQESDLIVLGVHGRGPVDLLFFGSTAQHVVRGATCPVLTMRTG